MTGWESLKAVLIRLRDERPKALTGYPDPRSDIGRRPPFRIHLAAWATDVAAELHDRFGSDVELTVGALPYPPRAGGPVRRIGAAAPVVDPGLLRIEPSGPLSVRSGRTERFELSFTNHSDADVTIHSNGQLTAVVVDPRTDRVVGGFAGAQTLQLVIARIPPGTTREFPLLVGTASFDESLGYAVQPGEWAVRADAQVDGNRLSTPTWPLVVTD